MSAALSQSRALAGSKAMTVVQRAPAVKQVSNGSKYFMKRNGSFMVEVNVVDAESEDQAVRRYMRAVVQSGVLNKLRARRYMETKFQKQQRRQMERAQARKLNIEEPTYEELYGGAEEGHPFDEWFCKPGDDDEAFVEGNLDLPVLDDVYGYNAEAPTTVADVGTFAGGYINEGVQQQQPQQQQQQEGGYAAPAQQPY